MVVGMLWRDVEEVVLLVMKGISESGEALSVCAVLCCASSLSHVQLFVSPWAVACQAPLSMGILQARILQWVTMPSSRGSSQPRDGTRVSCIAGEFFTV